MDLFVKIGVDDQASGKVAKITKSIGSGLSSAAKVGTAALAAVSTGVIALAKSSIDQYATYEQLVGGVETLFGTGGKSLEEYAQSTGKTVGEVRAEYRNLQKSQQEVMDNAANAYKTAGMSANEYMETVTSFSASLLQGLNGDTAKAAEVADKAITDMADNANKMGTSIEMIQNAYQGFAKQNYTMLDNLKLGYSGSQAEMARLINDSGVLGKSVEVTAESVKDVPFDKIIEAIHVIQEEIGITGTTAQEAATTISGSWASTKAAWANLLTGMADGSQDFDILVDNLADSATTFAGNIVPRVEQALGGVGKLIKNLAPVIVSELPGLVASVLPGLLNSAGSIVSSFVSAIQENSGSMISGAVDLLESLIRGASSNGPMVLETARSIVLTILQGLTENAPSLIPVAVDTIITLAESLTNTDSSTQILNAALALVIALGEGLIEALPELLMKVPQILMNLVNFLLTQGIPMVIEAGVQLLGSLLSSPDIIGGLLVGVGEILFGIVGAIVEFIPKIIEYGGQIIAGLWEGIKNSGKWLWDQVSGFFGDLGDKIKGFFSIESPSKWARDEVGAMLVKGVGVGFEDEGKNVEKTIADELERIKRSLNTEIDYRVNGNGELDDFYGNYDGVPKIPEEKKGKSDPIVGEQTFHIYLGEEKLTDLIVDIIRKEVRTT